MTDSVRGCMFVMPRAWRTTGKCCAMNQLVPSATPLLAVRTSVRINHGCANGIRVCHPRWVRQTRARVGVRDQLLLAGIRVRRRPDRLALHSDGRSRDRHQLRFRKRAPASSMPRDGCTITVEHALGCRRRASAASQRTWASVRWMGCRESDARWTLNAPVVGAPVAQIACDVSGGAPRACAGIVSPDTAHRIPSARFRSPRIQRSGATDGREEA